MQQKTTSSNKVGRLFATLIMLVGYYLISMPYALDWYSRIGQTATISGYKSSIETLSETEIKDVKQRMVEYNQQIAQAHEDEFYRYSSKQEFDSEYLALPVADSNEICSIEIPKINVNVPVGHGTDDDMLQTEIGHLYGTSLPIGGESTHAVVAGHSALRTAEMFTRLDELEIGDIIYVNILNEKHAYLVSDIVVVLPTECDQYMQVVPGEDLITLYTCTPYGINTHRLLVTAMRTDDPIIEESNESMQITVDEVKPKIIFATLVGLPIVIAIVANVVINKRERRIDRETN